MKASTFSWPDQELPPCGRCHLHESPVSSRTEPSTAYEMKNLLRQCDLQRQLPDYEILLIAWRV